MPCLRLISNEVQGVAGESHAGRNETNKNENKLVKALKNGIKT